MGCVLHNPLHARARGRGSFSLTAKPFDPPPPLMGEPATGTANPYPDSNKDDSKLSGHLLVLVRVVNMMLISPIVEVR